ncbi:SWIM zinc finger family protein [Lentzea sp. NPDC060358]|uniref:SWIM zinc finger family protein n=1 Tax=Lentzea sp. NPDC060358 TaxID=3347103 RepID=UPI00365EA785
MHSYAYVADSRLDETRRALGLQTSGGRAPNPRFFTGFLTDSQVAASSLLAIAKIAGTRYFQPTPERLRDPVVTCNGDRLRFESFSGCCGVYARLDVLGGALDGEVHDRGTTNVDVNEPLRRALARVTKGDPLHLTVGPDQVEVGTLDGAVVEKKVPLPPRWLRGFAETQVLTSRFDLRAELSPADAQRFLRTLPKGRAAVWAVPAGKSLRLSGSASGTAVCLAGPNRLEALIPLLRFAKAVRVYGPPSAGLPVASGWEVDLGAHRLTLVLSPEVNRGLSGEGAVLDGLAAGDADTDAELVGALLDFEPRVDVADLAGRSGLAVQRVKDALAQLGTAGRVGYDLAEASYFHRELPYDGADVQAMNPRLRNAKALVEQDAVRWDGGTAVVGGHRVNGEACTCQWWTEYRGGRGKCKHVLAADMVRGKA